MSNKLFVADLNTKDEVESYFLVKLLNIMEGKDGRKYLNIILMDCTGDLESRVWANAAEVASRIDKNSFVKVKGKVNFYQGRKQFIIAHIEKVDESQVDRNDYVVKAAEAPEAMFEKLLARVAGLDDVYIRELLQNILSDNEVARRLKMWQAGKSIHHAYQSGLLEHILSCTDLAIWLSAHYRVNKNYVVAGAILHDICKIYELTDGLNVEYTEEGKLVGHLVKGVELIDRYTYRIKNFPYGMKLHLKHILLSHHGEYEYGSPKIPQTSEAFLVHLIDLMDSKMASMDIVKKTDQSPGHWSGFVKHLDRVVYKSDLPFYPEYISDEEEAQARSPKREEVREEKPKARPHEREIKQNLGKLLGDFKID